MREVMRAAYAFSQAFSPRPRSFLKESSLPENRYLDAFTGKEEDSDIFSRQGTMIVPEIQGGSI